MSPTSQISVRPDIEMEQKTERRVNLILRMKHVRRSLCCGNENMKGATEKHPAVKYSRLCSVG